jgi:hypothetical protein
MFGQWEREGYPDDIGGYYYDSTADSYGILVVDPRPQRIAELRELFGGDIIITPCVFSYNELMIVNNEIIEMMKSNPDSGIYGVGIGWTNTGGAVHGFGESGKEFRVGITVDENVFDHYSAGFMNRYGERVYVEAGTGYTIQNDMDDGAMNGGSGETIGANIIPIEITGVFSGGISAGGSIFLGESTWLWLIIGIALLGTLLLFVSQRLRPTPAKQTTNGDIVTGNTALTKQQIITAVKNSESVPGDDLFKTILQRIDNCG